MYVYPALSSVPALTYCEAASEDAPAVPGRLWPVEQQLDDAAGEEESQREDFLGFGESQVYEGDTEESQLAPSGFRQTQSYEGDAEESQVFHDHAEQTLVDQPSATEKAPACPMPDPEPTDPHKINEMNVQLTQQLLTLDIQKAEIERLQEQALDEKEARRLLDETIACQKEKIEKIQGHAVQDQSTIRALQRQITEQLKQIRDLESLTQTQKDAIQEFTAQADTHERIREGLEITVKNNRQQIRTMEGIELDLRKTLEDRRDRNTALCNQITDLRASHAKTLATSQARYRKLAKDKAEEVAVREQELNTEIKRINKELSTRTSELKNIGHKLKKERLDANALRQEYEVLKEEHEGYEDAIKKIRVAVQF